MARARGPVRGNPFAGQYPPSVLALRKEDLTKGIKGIKFKFPNRHLTSTAYKSGLKKNPEQEGAK